MSNLEFGALGKQYTVEVGASWHKGTRIADGPANPVWDLAKKHDLTIEHCDRFDSTSVSCGGPFDLQYGYNGYNNYLDVFNATVRHLVVDSAESPAGDRIAQQVVDLNFQMGYAIIGSASEKRPPCSIYAQCILVITLKAIQRHDFTYNSEAGRFSNANELPVDQCGFPTANPPRQLGWMRGLAFRIRCCWALFLVCVLAAGCDSAGMGQSYRIEFTALFGVAEYVEFEFFEDQVGETINSCLQVVVRAALLEAYEAAERRYGSPRVNSVPIICLQEQAATRDRSPSREGAVYYALSQKDADHELYEGSPQELSKLTFATEEPHESRKSQ
ncbi:hypothetical protein BV22DRAFT_1123672 [Leucogyrophana mollusca]|uniref:Uncharacterized protein n=1 Tax=Leucogyrophana mollusca TaxID=85980 RepID=A0ACB8B0J1_9AGAM|nr:hypothetical protein BV22DRAFT_1123672 [Leucogyrophana mollusca]